MQFLESLLIKEAKTLNELMQKKPQIPFKNWKSLSYLIQLTLTIKRDLKSSSFF